MKRTLIFLSILFLSGMQLVAQQTFKIMTYNIRLDTPDDGQNAWVFRKDSVNSFLNKVRPDIFGLQEVVHNQLTDIQKALPNYGFVGVGRADGKTAGEYSPVFYLSGKFEKLDEGNFWLSETPEIPGSKSWDAACERIVSWVCLRVKSSGDTLYAFNTHFDHIGVAARFNSAGLILENIGKITGNHAVVLMGDFNSPTDESAYQRLITDSKTGLNDSRKMFQDNTLKDEITYTGFDQLPENDAFIDFIFINGRFSSVSSEIKKINDRNFYFSDHLPVVSEIVFVK
jgi:endonuclease/exonuclease/phosphatase family metal-dependent hydrolase